MTRPRSYGWLRRRVTVAAICTLPMLWMIVASVIVDMTIANGEVVYRRDIGR